MNQQSFHTTIAVVLTYQNVRDTTACIQSLQANAGPGLEILIVENGSEDGSDEQLSRTFPSIEMLRLHPNQGFTGGMNAGIQAALQTRMPNILLVSNDTLFDTGAVEALTASPWDIAVPKIVYADNPDTIWAAGCRWRYFPPNVKMIGLDQPDGPAYNKPIPLEYGTGCVLLFRRQVLEVIAGFDTRFRYYMEDYDLCYRARHAGFHIGYVPSARILHKVSKTLGRNPAEQWFFMGRNTALFYRKGQRFAYPTLWTYVTWFSTREIFRGRLALVRRFWAGIREGLDLLRQDHA